MTREQVEHQMVVAAAPKPTLADIGVVWWWRIKRGFFIDAEIGHFTGRPCPLGSFVVLELLAMVGFGLRGKRT